MAEKPRIEGQDRRERYRLTRDTKVLVKNRETQSSEIGSIQNMTRTGIYFEGYGDYQPGMTVAVEFPYDPTKPELGKPQFAEVVRVREVKDSIKKGVAVKLLNLFLKP